MTRPKRKAESQLHGLKWLLAAGSLAAALLGTRLLAVNELVDKAVMPETETQTEVMVIPERPQPQLFGLSNEVQIGSRTIELAPIPKAASRPVARSRSSR